MTLSTMLVVDRKVRSTVHRVLENLSEMKKTGERAPGYYTKDHGEEQNDRTSVNLKTSILTGKRSRNFGKQEDSTEDGNGKNNCDQGNCPPREDIAAKKPKLSGITSNFSCPFRRRNPLRFNVRDHPKCALAPFSDITLLKYVFGQ